MNDSTEFETLEDMRARVIYYSCLAEPKNILEITKLWDYKTSTYFYQKKSKEIIQAMVTEKLVLSYKGAHFDSNYDLLLTPHPLLKFFEKTNHLIANDIIIQEYEYEVTAVQLEDKLFREYCLDKKPKLKEILQEIIISEIEVNKFYEFWKTKIFRNVFLSAENLKKIVGNRQGLPKNPREFLFSMTVGLCDRVYSFKREDAYLDFPTPYLWVDIDEILPLVIVKLEENLQNMTVDLKMFSEKFQEVYKMLVKKFSVLEEKSEVSDYHIKRFANLIGI